MGGTAGGAGGAGGWSPPPDPVPNLKVAVPPTFEAFGAGAFRAGIFDAVTNSCLSPQAPHSASGGAGIVPGGDTKPAVVPPDGGATLRPELGVVGMMAPVGAKLPEDGGGVMAFARTRQ